MENDFKLIEDLNDLQIESKKIIYGCAVKIIKKRSANRVYFSLGGSLRLGPKKGFFEANSEYIIVSDVLKLISYQMKSKEFDINEKFSNGTDATTKDTIGPLLFLYLVLADSRNAKVSYKVLVGNKPREIQVTDEEKKKIVFYKNKEWAEIIQTKQITKIKLSYLKIVLDAQFSD